MTTSISTDTSSSTQWVFQVEWKGKLVLMVGSGCCGTQCLPGEHELMEWQCGESQDAVLWCVKCDSYGELL